MSFLLALSISTGVSCGIWALISSFPALGLITWVGFAGCTAYFACGKHGMEGISSAFFSNFSGIISAVIAVFISGLFPAIPAMAIVMTAIISGTMCLKSLFKPAWFIPGAFIGCFSSFAYISSGANLLSADIVPFIISIICGYPLAYCCDKGGTLLYSMLGKKEEQN